jgi:hypothetical protein
MVVLLFLVFSMPVSRVLALVDSSIITINFCRRNIRYYIHPEFSNEKVIK